MEIAELIARQKAFDEAHATKFEWAQQISAQQTQPLLYIALALAGEVGELANVVKKLERGDYDFAHAVPLLKEEIADVLIYLLKLAYQTDIDLEAAFLEKLHKNRTRFVDQEKRQPGGRAS